MSRTLPLLAATALALGAAACAPTTGGLTAENNPSLYSVHQPVVQRTDFVLDLATSGDSVPASELARLNAWFASIDIGYGDRIALDAPDGYAMPGVTRDIASVAGQYGLLVDVGAPITTGQVAPGSVRVVASRATASVPNCPNWANNGVSPDSNTSSNYGCATNSNLAAMVADPNDLVLGQPGSVSRSATTATRAIRTYREVLPTGRQGLGDTSTRGE